MIKRILLFVASAACLFIITYPVHSYFIANKVSYQLWHVYTFHVVACILVYLAVELVASKLPNQAGYAYLMLMFFKIGAFVLIFQTSVFIKESLTQADRFGLIIPLFLFLVLEAIGVSKLFNSK
ncbi:DUF6168 family protein [Siansivirga zeaxanthinifaciens]|uniref:Uncharacterized protein n=1 Tax=Siansivirga zeaxanthinifaciens CC-SAMT-1 TaxID=1454006 RepID=A0A0C5WBW8_9FLAO|nr:DUF6168 family protein [Siansivirga zeaxanthinifaciens]AJR02849.1 hypothetical protein AW14_03535 [Siansivirga zeaxanthinifaciens CC-SAMT-1]